MALVTIDSIDFSNYLGIDYNEKKEKNFLKMFYERLESGEAYEQDFNIADEDGNLIYNYMGYTIFMSNKEVLGSEYNRFYRASKCRPYSVVVLSIDEKEKRIEVSHAKAKVGEKERLCKMLDDLISQGKQCEVPVKIERVYPNIAIGDIGGLGIPCIIRIKDWSIAYTSDMTARVSRGDIIQVAVVNKKTSSAERSKYFPALKQKPYVCSRKLQMEGVKNDPWKDIEKRVPAGTIITITCEVKGDSHFFGRIDGVSEINVYGLYPEDSTLTKADIIPGLKYQCIVRKVSEADKILRARPFKCLDDLGAAKRKLVSESKEAK